MNILESRLYGFLEKIADLLLLNLLWLIMCLPIITIFPSTVAMFGVVRNWVAKKEGRGVCISFFSLLKKSLRQSIGISILWTAIGLFLVWDSYLIQLGSSLFHQLLLIILLFVWLFYISTTIYLFPVLAHIESNWKSQIRNSFTMVFVSPLLTFALLGITVISVSVIYVMPISIFIIVSTCAYIIYTLCNYIFQRQVIQDSSVS